MAIKSNNNKGNPYHDEQTGEFTSPGSASGNNTPATNPNTNKTIPSFLKQKSSTSTPSFLNKKGSNGNSDKYAKMFEEAKKGRWWKSRKFRTVDEVEQEIGDYFDDEVVDFLRKYNFKTVDSMGARKTSHASINTTLSNIIARKMFHPLKIMDTQEFDQIWSRMNIQNGGRWQTSKIPYADYSTIERGFHNKAIIDEYLGIKTDNPVVLPNGMYGSCVYSAYDGSTARSYAGSSGIVMKYLVDNKNGHTITSGQYNIKKNEMIKKVDNMKNNIISSLTKRGVSDNDAQQCARIFENTLRKDYTFAGLLMGYDVIYETVRDFSLILNWKNISTKKDWR